MRHLPPSTLDNKARVKVVNCLKSLALAGLMNCSITSDNSSFQIDLPSSSIELISNLEANAASNKSLTVPPIVSLGH